MDDAIRSYQQARRRLDRATTRAEELTHRARYVAVLLEDWQTVEIEHADFEGPSGTSMPLDAREWPTIDEVAAALTEWHRAAAKVVRAWEAIPPADRIGLQPPPEDARRAAGATRETAGARSG